MNNKELSDLIYETLNAYAGEQIAGEQYYHRETVKSMIKDVIRGLK